MVGLAIAAASLVATAVTGNPIFDAAGSVAVGCLLGSIAVYLIQTNRRALVGRSLSASKATPAPGPGSRGRRRAALLF